MRLAPKHKTTSTLEVVHFSQTRRTTIFIFGVGEWLSGRVSDRSERLEVRNLPPPCCVLEQDTLLPESTG